MEVRELRRISYRLKFALEASKKFLHFSCAYPQFFTKPYLSHVFHNHYLFSDLNYVIVVVEIHITTTNMMELHVVWMLLTNLNITENLEKRWGRVDLTTIQPWTEQAGLGARIPEDLRFWAYVCVILSLCAWSPLGSLLVSVSVSLSCERARSVHLKPLGWRPAGMAQPPVLHLADWCGLVWSLLREKEHHS